MNDGQVYGGALIHFEDSFTGSLETNLLDLTPGSRAPSAYDTADPVLVAGQSWVDPYSGLSIQVLSATPQSLKVQVTRSAPSCSFRVTPERVASISTRNSSVNGNGVLGGEITAQANWMISFLSPNQGIPVG
jgi:hypothetical protein